MTEKFTSKKAFVESLGATCTNWHWSFSYVNHAKKEVLFTDFSDQQPDGNFLIASDSWKSANGHKQSMEHIQLVLQEGYDLLTFPAKAKDGGEQGTVSFTSELTKKYLRGDDEGNWYSVEAANIDWMRHEFKRWLFFRAPNMAQRYSTLLMLDRRNSASGNLEYPEVREALLTNTVYSIQTSAQYQQKQGIINDALEQVQDRRERQGNKRDKTHLNTALNRYGEFLQEMENGVPLSEEISDTVVAELLHEGAKKLVTINAYERNAAARFACIQHHGCQCAVCDFDFAATYGALGEGFIHVHHIVPLAEVQADYVVDPIKDLIPVCPNCHAMIHRQREALTVEALRTLKEAAEEAAKKVRR